MFVHFGTYSCCGKVLYVRHIAKTSGHLKYADATSYKCKFCKYFLFVHFIKTYTNICMRCRHVYVFFFSYCTIVYIRNIYMTLCAKWHNWNSILFVFFLYVQKWMRAFYFCQHRICFKKKYNLALIWIKTISTIAHCLKKILQIYNNKRKYRPNVRHWWAKRSIIMTSIHFSMRMDDTEQFINAAMLTLIILPICKIVSHRICAVVYYLLYLFYVI